MLPIEVNLWRVGRADCTCVRFFAFQLCENIAARLWVEMEASQPKIFPLSEFHLHIRANGHSDMAQTSLRDSCRHVAVKLCLLDVNGHLYLKVFSKEFVFSVFYSTFNRR